MPDIRKQPSPVMVTVSRQGKVRCAPRAAPMDQPIAWLLVGMNQVRGPVAVKASAAQNCETVASRKTIASGQVQRRKARRKAIGSQPQRAKISLCLRKSNA